MEVQRIKQIVEAALMAADEPLPAERLVKLFKRGEVPIDELRAAVKQGLAELEEECAERGYELKRVASGYRYQVRQEYSEWVSRLWDEKPPRYSRALLETLSLIAYKQPVTRGDIEQVRGVAVSQNIMRTLLERGWIREVGTRDVPGRPALYGTTKAFLDYFNLKSLNQLPPLAEIKAMLEPAAGDAEIDSGDADDQEGESGTAQIEANEQAESGDSAHESAPDADEVVVSEDAAEVPTEDDTLDVGEITVELDVVDEAGDEAVAGETNVVQLPTAH